MSAAEPSIADRLKEVDSIEQLHGLLVNVAPDTLPAAARGTIRRKAGRLPAAAPPVRVAVLSDFSLDFLPDELTVESAFAGKSVETYLGAYNQYFQEVLDSQSGLHRFEPDIIVLALSVRMLEPRLHYEYAEMASDERDEIVDAVTRRMGDWISLAEEHTGATILVSGFIEPPVSHLGLADSREPESERETYQKLNRLLRERLASSRRAYLLDAGRLALDVGWRNVFEPKMYYLAKMAWSRGFLQVVAREIVRFAVALKGHTKKCLVLDMDNTLWGGVVGEDGVDGVRIGPGDPVSEAYLDFQYRIKQLKQRGILLAACSKNNRADVEELFSARHDMALSMDDFAATRINWDLKDQNIRAIAGELNIGLDSLVFIDDNPAEIALVRQAIPEVVSLLLPESHEQFLPMLDSLPWFEKLQILADDRKKTQQYQDNKKREALQDSTTDLASYLKSLETRVILRRVGPEQQDRIHQLFNKTNQFNVTTIRYTFADVESFTSDSDCDFFYYTVSDKFGDLGIVGVILVAREGETARIDSFLMSCRAMGRKIETAILSWLKEYYLVKGGFKRMKGKYIPTKKNPPVEALFGDHGFKKVSGSEQGADYEITSDQVDIEVCDWIDLDAGVDDGR